MYQNFIFDLYGTLLDIRTNEDKVYLWKKMSEIYSAMGAAYSGRELKEAFRKLERELSETLPENGELDLRPVFSGLFHQKGIICNEQTIINIAVVFRTLSRNRLQVYEGVTETLQMLKENGKGIYLLSNAQTDFTRPELRMTGLESWFDGILISSEAGYKKPGREFFDCLFESFHLLPEECLMVGNDEFSDIAGAVSAGMDSLYIHTEISPQEPVKGMATYSVMDGDWKKVQKIMENLIAK